MILALALIPYVFKDKIVDHVREAANTNINAVVDFSDIDLSLFRAFPDVSIRIQDLKVTGKDTFDQVSLLAAEALDIEVNLPSLWNPPYQVHNISMNNGRIDLKILKNGQSNWDIFPESSSDTADVQFDIKLSEYGMRNIDITYDDRSSGLFADLDNLTHTGSGSMNQDVYDLSTKTIANGFTYRQGGITYIKEAPLDLEAQIHVDVPSNTYTLKDNDLKIQNLKVNGDGQITLMDDDRINIKANLAVPNTDFKSFYAIVPNAYTSDLDKADGKGNAAFNINIDGIYDGKKGLYPAFDVDMNIKDGYIKYAGLPDAISDVQVKATAKSMGGNLSDLTINIPGFGLKLGQQSLQGVLQITDPTSNTRVKGTLKGDVDLQKIGAAYPLTSNTTMGGRILIDLDMDITKNDAINKNINAMKLDGQADIQQLTVQMEGIPPISIPIANAIFSPAASKVTVQKSTIGASDFKGDMDIKNLPSYLTSDTPLELTLNASSTKFDLNELIPKEAESNQGSPLDLSGYDVTWNVSADQVLYDTYDMKDLKGAGTFKQDNIQINQGSTMMGGTDIALSGSMGPLSPYLNTERPLKGDLNLVSKSMNFNDLMASSETTTEPSVVPVPAAFDFDIKTVVDRLVYDNITLNNVRGNIIVANQIAEIRNATASGLGGTMGFEGSYATLPGEEPAFSFKYDLSKLRFPDAFKSVSTFQAFAPIMQYLDGFLNSTLVMDGKLTDKMFPDLKSLNVSGFLETIDTKVNGLPVLNKIGEKLSIEDLKKLALDNTKNWVEIKNGRLELKPRNIEYKGIKMTVSGSHGLDVDMDYSIVMSVPKALWQNSTLGAAANSGLSFLEKEANKIGLNLSTGDNIDLLVSVGGQMKDPKIGIKPIGVSDGKGLLSTAEQAVKDRIQQEVDHVKDSIRNRVNEEKKILEDTIRKTANKAVDSIKTRANEEIDKAKKEAEDKAKQVVNTAIDSLANKVLDDSLKNAVKDKINDAINTKGAEDKIKEKLKDFNPFKKKGNG